MNNAKIENLYDLDKTIAADLFKEHEYPWELLPLIGDFIKELGAKLQRLKYLENILNMNGLIKIHLKINKEKNKKSL